MTYRNERFAILFIGLSVGMMFGAILVTALPAYTIIPVIFITMTIAGYLTIKGDKGKYHDEMF